MTNLSCDVIKALRGHTLATAESCTGGGIGSALTSVSGSSSVFKGGIISYTNEIKERILGVDEDLLLSKGAVSAEVAKAMAVGARNLLKTDYAVSVTGLAGPGGDSFGNAVGTVYIGFSDGNEPLCRRYLFSGSREDIRNSTVRAALELILEEVTK